MNYTLNAEAAKAADTIGNRIEETGKYIGVFTRAQSVTSEKGAKGVDLSFKADDGRSADYLTIWTHGKDGKEIYGFKQLMAVMACLQVKTLTATPGTVEKWDSIARSKVMESATIYPEMMNKPVGLLLRKEEYLKKDQSIGNKLNIFGAFEASTEFTASEILGKSSAPEQLGKMCLSLKDKPVQMKHVATQQAPDGDFDDFSSDIPF